MLVDQKIPSWALGNLVSLREMIREGRLVVPDGVLAPRSCPGCGAGLSTTELGRVATCVCGFRQELVSRHNPLSGADIIGLAVSALARELRGAAIGASQPASPDLGGFLLDGVPFVFPAAEGRPGRVRILEALALAGGVGMTTMELYVALGMTHQSAGARVAEMAKRGEIVASTMKRGGGTVWLAAGIRPQGSSV